MQDLLQGIADVCHERLMLEEDLGVQRVAFEKEISGQKIIVFVDEMKGNCVVVVKIKNGNKKKEGEEKKNFAGLQDGREVFTKSLHDEIVYQG